MLNISQVILMRTDSNLCRKELTVHWSAPNSLIRSYLQPCTNSTWGDESEAMVPIIWLYQIVDAQKEDVFFPKLLITLRSYGTWHFDFRSQSNRSRFLGSFEVFVICAPWLPVYLRDWLHIWQKYNLWSNDAWLTISRSKVKDYAAFCVGVTPR